MSFVEAPSSPFNDTPDITFSLAKHNRYLTIIIPVWILLIICIFCLCYYTLTNYYNVQVQQQTQGQGIELGLSSPQQLQLVVVNMPEDKDDQEAFSFKKVSWTEYKEEKNNKSHDDEDVSDQCVICFEEFVDGDECRVRSKCNHIFHRNCINGWLSTHLTCPICRGGVPGFVCRYVATADQNPAIRV